MNWRKATYSGNGEACVEVASSQGIHIRDTTDPDGTTLTLPPAAWTAFLTTLR